MGYKQTAPDGWWPWRSWVNNRLQQLHTDVQRLLRQTNLPPMPGGAPFGPPPFTTLPGTSGNGGAVYEGFLAGTLAASDSTGGTPGTATLNLWAVVSGTWAATGCTGGDSPCP